MLAPELRRNISFAQHNLVTDGSFNEFHLVVCRNVLIYFNRTLQDRVHRLLYQSLVRFGFLGLGTKETVRFTPHEAALRGASPSASTARWREMARPPEAPVTADAGPEPRPARTGDDRVNILLVDDRPDKLLALESILADLGQNMVRAYLRTRGPARPAAAGLRGHPARREHADAWTASRPRT